MRLEQNCFKNNNRSKYNTSGRPSRAQNQESGLWNFSNTGNASGPSASISVTGEYFNSFAKTSLQRQTPGLLALGRVQRMTGPVRPMAHILILTVMCEKHFDYCVVDEWYVESCDHDMRVTCGCVWHDPWRRRTWVAETCVADCYEAVQKSSANIVSHWSIKLRQKNETGTNQHLVTAWTGSCLSIEQRARLMACVDVTRNVYVLLTVHLSISLDNDQLDAHLLYFTIRLLKSSIHVSSIICSSWGGWIVLMQHLVSFSQSVAVRCTGWERAISLPTCAPDGHLQRVTIPDAASIQFILLMLTI